jgi:hypothetical protein
LENSKEKAVQIFTGKGKLFSIIAVENKDIRSHPEREI